MKIIKTILNWIIIVGVIVALTTGANILFFWTIFNWIQNLIHVMTGFDVFFAKALASFFLAAVVMFPFGKVILSFLPVPQKNKPIYRALIFVVIGVLFLLSFFGSQDTYFNVKTGKALKYYSVLPNGEYRVYSEPGFDHLTGEKLKEVTGEVALKIKEANPSFFSIPDSVVKEKEPVESVLDLVLDSDTVKPAFKQSSVKSVEKNTAVDNSRGIRKLKKSHYPKSSGVHQNYLSPEQVQYVNH